MRKLAYIFGVALFLFGCVTSLETVRMGVHLNPNDAEAHLNLGNKYFELE